jgi:hypothetical protein
MNEDDEDPPPDVMREASEVARRCCVLIAIVSLGHQQPRDATVGWLMDEGLWDYVTPKEREFIMDSSPSQQSIVDATWRAEALHVLLWSLSRIESLCPPTQQCSLSAECDASPYLRPTADFIATAQLRSEEEITSALDIIYHTHWEVRDAQIRGREVPNGYVAGAVMERHYALNWLTGYCGQDWDDITTDT